MIKNFSLLEILAKISSSSSTGCLKISGNQVSWDLCLIDGKLQYGFHSLLSLELIEKCLDNKNASSKKINSTMALAMANSHYNHQPNSLGPITTWYKQAQTKEFSRNRSEKIKMLGEITQEALETLLWLKDGEYQWVEELGEFTECYIGDNEIITENKPCIALNLEIPPLIESLKKKKQGWEKLSPIITSCYQRPYCQNLKLLKQPVPSGQLSTIMLSKIAKLMQGINLRELALILKQDVLKVARLLYPYIKENVFQLESPQAPFNLFPSISVSQSDSQKNIFSLNPTKNQTKKLKTYKIVCIDDSPIVLNTIQNYLENENIEIVSVMDPTKSIPTLFKVKPDLILMDISMPGINGNRLCQMLKNSSGFKNLPIIMISGDSGIKTQLKTQEVGATDFLAKPFTKESLIEIIKKYLPNI